MSKLKFVLGAIGAFIILIGIPALADTYQSTYTQYGEIWLCDIDETLIVDATGNVWSVSPQNEYNEGDTVKIKFFTNYTDYTREDDEILKISIDN